ncbi:hypothetical protein COCSADRAFT_160188 [Bipolaris sorokiniana ND90Pr]|uniref:SET domain-containing protein n=1 Tax=Cochliobolus sativus (strain ND90Pr / ATCC 201652) TaxID=665912 RepID=M2SSF7_COCSN|nr:uncharacterized protein COCSADRAFT_160188 [Bipolaris sorokiniana ND90Pr]EMD65215.1 hypothetical protein COCSADRAFT_160188 [Bipolaris sorokiniana ND90Pr]
MSSPRSHRRSIRLALSALLLTSVTASLDVHEGQNDEEEIYYLPRSAAIHDGFVNKPLSTCPVKPGGVQMSYTFPWTHTPSCVNILQPEGAPKTFCAYTNVNYNNGRGISFVTSPEVAASVSMETFGMAIGGMEGQIGEEMGMWEVKEAGSKGKGLFAKKNIGAIFPGESLVMQTPVLIVDKSALETESREEVERVLLTAVAQLPSKSRKMAVELSGNEDGSFEDIVKTNGIGFTWPWVDEMPKLLSVTPEIARINHACRPNTLWRFNDYTLTFEVFALKDIKPGEEITRSYGFEKRSHGRRVRSLEANFGFTCACPLCTASDEEIMASNDRLSEIKALKSVLPSDPEEADRTLEILPSLVEQLEKEDLIAELPSYEETLAYTWSMFGEEEKAKYWAGKAQKHWAIVAGKESWEQRRCGDMEQDVKGHKTWRTWKGLQEEDEESDDEE